MIHGLQVARQAPVITHLFFADDSLLFARATGKEADRIMATLKTYELASGQVVNLDKSEVSFIQNVREEDKSMIRDRMGVKIVSNHSKYLGLPMIFGRSKKEIFAMVVERVWKKIKGWKEKFLSRTGKEVLIKDVTQAIPTYIMSCYKLPETICHEIEAMLAKFWWGSKNGERKVHWLSWECLARSKSIGGMGFWGISEFNKRLLGKQYWRLMNNENSLVGKVFKRRYFPRVSIDKSNRGFAPSYVWRSILGSRELIQLGSRWRIGNGHTMEIFNDIWLPLNSGFKVKSQSRNLDVESKFVELIDERASKLPGPLRPPCKRLWQKIWSCPVNNRIRNFLWRTAGNILPTKTNLLCICYYKAPETVNHLLLDCEFARQTFFSSMLSYRIPSGLDFKDWLLKTLTCGDVFSTQMLSTLAYKVDTGKDVPSFRDVHFLQVDASVLEGGITILGCVFKDHNQVVIYAACRKEIVSLDVVDAEIMAIRWGLMLAKELKIERIVVQSDAKTVVDCVNLNRYFAVLEPIVVDVRFLLSSFNFLLFCFSAEPVI
ncbi:uncharacterized protein LOC131614373 [Vicia villosa]|uniref:uncharacterized protein LOC131614373 n=1 Tax=Vicia villosa TaxID=3911 RepID=UPI00273B5CC9|nr:uncharacterized protein LOC131614373 [Vicia villosa]